MQSGLQAHKLTLDVKNKKQKKKNKKKYIYLLFLINVNWFIKFITGYKNDGHQIESVQRYRHLGIEKMTL